MSYIIKRRNTKKEKNKKESKKKRVKGGRLKRSNFNCDCFSYVVIDNISAISYLNILFFKSLSSLKQI